jgi:hypothetical protein
MPWLGFYHKIDMADTHVILDNIPFRKNYFQNRNKIRTSNGWLWLTVPVKFKFGQRIKDVPIDNASKRWKKKYWESLCLAYKKAPFFSEYSERLESIFNRDWARISELNISIILSFLEFFGLKKRVIKASDIEVEGKGSTLILNICKRLSAKVYISGISGKEYLNLQDFKDAGIGVIFQEFHHPVYRQLYEPFIPYMSAVDLLFNYGDKGAEIMNGVGVPVMKEVLL